MKITYLSHSTILLEINNIKIIVDPFLSKNNLFNKQLLNKYINSKIDYMLITHAHYDHICDVELFSKNNPDMLIISNYEISNYFNKKNISSCGINYGSFITFPFGKIKYTFALHSSSFNDGSYGGNPGGFLLHTNEGNIYISGDTSITYEMKFIPKFGDLNLSVLPIGGVYTMDVYDSIIASDLLKCDQILGVHYDTFENIKINKEKSIKEFYNKEKKLILLNCEESIII
ncbi:metal-dependent hydrolase [Blattabacterium cuenoti]|uniref:metal-dependent hydrolase n=1 Tax=Blattabacterium cuenoti TaxID=1653831 RepID=UPI00163BD9AC|nr:metal-dependent hydrolase [Blattabacterium cuenoti]